MQGRRDRARRAAQRARELAPELARAQTVLGFAELAEINTGRAKKAFRRAIDLDSANPLPRFGLGLATIRAGDLEGGRKEIEIAVALDPENALLRSYLGKAYFDERTTNPLTYFQELVTNFPNQENTLAAQQFAISKAARPERPDALALRRHPPAEREPPGRGAAQHREVDRAERQPRRLPLARAARPGPGGARHQPRPHLQRPRLRAARHQRGDQVAELRPRQRRRPPVSLRCLRHPAAPRDRPCQRAACRRSSCRTSTSTRCSRA